MAGQPDGSIIIDTEVKSDGFKAGSDELLSAIRALSDEIQSLRTTLTELFSKTFSPNVDTSGAERNVSELEARVRELEASLGALQNGGEGPQINLDGTTQKASSLQRQIDSVNSSVDKLEPTFQRAMTGSESAMATFEGKANVLERKIAELQGYLDRIGQTEYPTQEYEALCAEVDKTSQRFDELVAQQEKMQELGVSEESLQWQNVQRELELVGEKYRELAALKQQLESSGNATRLVADTSQFAQLEAPLTAAKQRLDEMRNAASQAGSEVENTNSSTEKVKENTRQTKSHMNGIATAAKNVAAAIGKASKSAIGSLARGIKTAASHMARMLFHGKSMQGQFKGLISSAKKFALSLLGARGVYALLRKAVSAYMAQNEELKNKLDSCWSGIGNLLGPLITKVINLVAQAVAYVTSFLKLFGMFGDTATGAINNAGNAATGAIKELKRQLASFDELNVLSDNSSNSDSGSGNDNAAPQLPDVTLPDWAQLLVEQIRNGDWAAAATTLANQLNGMIASVDWAGIGQRIGYFLDGVLTFLATFIDAFDWHNLGKSLATLLNNIIKSVDWKNLGKLLVAKWTILLKLLNGFFETFDGKAFGDSLYDLLIGAITACDWVGLTGSLARNISNFIQSIDFAKLGKALSDGMRTMLQSLNAGITNFDWRGLGKKIADFLKGIDWRGIFRDLVSLVGNLFVAAFDLFDGFASEIDWPGLAGDIAHELSDAINGINFGAVASTLSSGIRTALQSITTGISEFDWAGLGGQIADFLNGIDWSGIFSDLVSLVSSVLIGALDLLGGFVSEADWVGIADDIWGSLESLINDIDWDEFGSKLGQFLSDAINGILRMIGSLFTDHDWGQMIQDLTGSVGGALVSLIANIDWLGLAGNLATALIGMIMQIPGILVGALGGIADIFASIFEALGLDGIAGFFKGISDALSNVGTWLKENLVDPVVNWVKDLFGIHSPSTVFAEIGDWLIQGLLGGISDAWHTITEFFTGAVEGLKNLLSGAWEGIKSAAEWAWNGISTTLSNAWEGIKSTASDGWEAVKSGVSSAWESVSSWTSEKWEGVKSTVSDVWDGIKSTASDGWENVKSGVSSAWESVSSWTSEKWNGIKDTLSSTWESVKSTASTTWENLKTTVGDGWESVKTTTSNVWNNLKSSLSETWENLKSKASTTWENMKSGASTAWENMKSNASTTWNNIKSSLSTTWENIKTNASTAWENIKGAIQNKGWSGVGENICSGISTGLSDGWQWLKEKAKGLACGLLDGIKGFLGIHSPSTVFRDEVGLNIGYGIGEGVVNSEPAILKAVSGVADAIAEEVNAGDYAIKDIMPVSEVDGALTSFTDKIGDSFTSMLDRLQDIAKHVTFDVPAVSYGAIPYKAAAVAASGHGADISSTIEASNDELADVITQVVANATSSIVAAIQNHSVKSAGGFDRAGITDIVIGEINRRTRMMNKSPLLG